jgi:hypothetical protein
MNLKRKSKGLFFLAILNSLLMLAQQQDDITTEVSYTLEGNSDIDLVNYKMSAAVFSKALKNYKGQFSVRLIAERSDISYNKFILQENDLGLFYTLGVELTYFKILNKKWSTVGIVRPQLSSNFSSGLTSDDINPNVTWLFNYSNTPTKRLSFGATYLANSPIGIPILPYLNYWQQLNDKAEMNLGIYESSYSYKAFKETTLTAFLGFEGFNYNISENFMVGHQMAESVNYVEVKTGLRLKQKLSSTVNLNISTGYTLSRNFDIVDASQDSVIGFDLKNNFSFSAGLNINFGNKKQQAKNE